MSIYIPIISDAYDWYLNSSQNADIYTLNEERRIDAEFRQAESIPAKLGFGTLSTIHGLSSWFVNTPHKLTSGFIGFVGGILTDPITTIGAIPDAVLAASDEIIRGGHLMAEGRTAEGVHRALDGITIQVLTIMGGRAMFKTTALAAPEAARLTNEGLTRINKLRSQTADPFDIWMRHPERGAVAGDAAAPKTTDAKVIALPRDPILVALEHAETPTHILNATLRQLAEYPEKISTTHIPSLIRLARNEMSPYPHQRTAAIRVLGKWRFADASIVRTLTDIADTATHLVHDVACDSLIEIAKSNTATPETYAHLATWHRYVNFAERRYYPGISEINRAAYKHLGQLDEAGIQEAAPILAKELHGYLEPYDMADSTARANTEFHFSKIFNQLANWGNPAGRVPSVVSILRKIARGSDEWKANRARRTLNAIKVAVKGPSETPWEIVPYDQEFHMNVPAKGIQEYRIGRHPLADIVSRNKHVSDIHADLDINMHWRVITVTDMNSTNGTTVQLPGKSPITITHRGQAFDIGPNATTMTIRLGDEHGITLVLHIAAAGK